MLGLGEERSELAPVLAEMVADFLETGAADPEVFVADSGER